MVFAALRESALRVYSSQIGEPFQVLDLLDTICGSNPATTRMYFLKFINSKQFSSLDYMLTYIDEL